MILPSLLTIRSFSAENTELYVFDTESSLLIVKNFLPFSYEIYPDTMLIDKYN